jgi:hypothetical protein
MEILQADISKRSRPVLVRLTPEIHGWLLDLSGKAGGGIATTIRSILEAAHRDGVSVVAALDDEDEDEPRRRRRA